MIGLNKKIVFFIFLCCFFSTTIAANPIIIPDTKIKANHLSRQKDNRYPSTTEFSSEKISKSPVFLLSDFLKQEQSIVYLKNNSGDTTQTALSIRGFGDNASANSLILIDGFPLTNPTLLAPNFNSIPLSDIAHIEIFPGSQGTLWGDQAVGGVVNIITKHPKKLLTHFILNVGSYNNDYANLLVGNKKNQWFYKIFAALNKNDGYRHHQQQSGNNIAVQIGNEGEKGTVTFNLQSYGGMTYFPGGLTLQQFNQHPQAATEFHNNRHYRTTIFQIFNRYLVSQKWLVESRLAYQQTNSAGFVFVNFTGDDSQFHFNPRLIFNWQKKKIMIGYQTQLARYQLINSAAESKVNTNQQHIYSQVTLPVNETVDVIIGARKAWQFNHALDRDLKQSSLNQVGVTEQGIIYHPTQTISFFLRRDGNFSFPKANEQTWLASNSTSLQVQTGTSYETGLQYQIETLQLQFSLYHLQLHNEIAFNPTQTEQQPFGAFTNYDKTIRQGLSFLERYQITDHLAFNSQLNYVRARFSSGKFSGKTIPAVPAVTANVGLDYSWNEKWSAQYNLLYTGSRYASDDVENISKRMAPYWLHDIALQYQQKYFIMIASIKNVFNTHYANYVFYDSVTQQNTYYSAIGRSFSLTLKVNID